MKKMLRLAALVLALVLCFTITAVAAGTTSSKAVLTSIDGNATVEFDSSNEEIINVTYTNATAIQEGGYYLVMVIAPDEDGNYVPTKESILYIDQTTGNANGSISFAVYPSAITDSAIAIYGMNNRLIAAVIDGKYLLGDVDRNGLVNVGDATLLLRYLASLEPEEKVDMEAANVDGNTAVNVGDATKLLRFLAQLDTLG